MKRKTNIFNAKYQIYFLLCFRLGSDPYKLYPFKVFQMQLQQFGKFGLLNASIVLPILTKEIDLHVDSNATQSNKNDNGSQVSDSLRKRLRDIVSDSQRLGYI